jgi:beta-lactamase class A
MDRRNFALGLAAALAGGSPLVALASTADWAAMERASGGRMGIAVLREGQALQGHRLDERFAMCSTFKWLAAAHVLRRVDQGQEQLARRVKYGEPLPSYSPVTGKHLADGMTMAELCHAAITLSDNGAANLILKTLGGPEGLTRFIRSVGDDVTRLDRWEPELNEARPGDPRDTSTPRSMAQLLRTLVLGDALSPRSREQLAQWLQATATNAKRLGAHKPAGWRLGSKTGTGERGSTNDVGIYWPAQGAPIVVAVFVTETQAPQPQREAAIAEVAGAVTLN